MKRTLLILVLALSVAAHLSAQVLVFEDPLNGGTKGAEEGGEFLPDGGWTAAEQFGRIIFELPRALRDGSVVEIDVRNFNPTGQIDAPENFIIGLWEKIWNAGGDQNIPNNDCFYMYAGTKYPQFKLKFHTHGFSHHEKNYDPVLAFDPNHTYTLRFEWKDRIFRASIDGVTFLVYESPEADPHDRVKFIELGARSGKNPREALRGPVYSNLRVYAPPPADRGAPSDLIVAAQTPSSVSLRWDPPYEPASSAKYVVFRDGERVGTAGEDRKFQDKGLPEGRYDYTVSVEGRTARSEPLRVTITQPKITAARTASAITIDGALNESEWSAQRAVLRGIAGEPGNRVHAGALWDEEHLYLAVRVLDDEIQSDSDSPFDDDAIELLIDGNNNGGTGWHARYFDSADAQILCRVDERAIHLKLGEKPLRTLSGSSSPVRYAVKRTGHGYTLEVAAPWSTLGIRPEAGATVGLDVRQYDDDDGGPGDAVLVWMSEGPSSTITSAYGDLVLGGPAS